KLAERAQRLGEHLRNRLESLRERQPLVGDVRGLGAMMAIELVKDRETRAPATEETGKAVNLARSRGLLILPTGTYGNVLGFRVERRRRLVEDEDLAVAHERARERDLLPLPARQLVPLFEPPAEHGVELLRQLLDQRTRTAVVYRPLDARAIVERRHPADA